MSDNEAMNAQVRAMFEDAGERTALAQEIYEALTVTGKLSSHRVLTYRCPHRCLLLDVLQLPEGHLIHQPRYKLSVALNEATTNAAGRNRNTEDGNRRWKAQTFFAVDAAGFSLSCDHLAGHHLTQEAYEADLRTDLREIVVST